MLTNNEIEKAAKDLFEAEAENRQIGLLSKQYPNINLDDAYRIQSELINLYYAAGRKRIGWKIGLTSKAMQRSLAIDTPDSGVLFDTMLFTSGDEIPKNRFIEPRIEVEIAFILKNHLPGADTTLDDVMHGVETVIPAIEILDTRIVRRDPNSGAMRTIHDTISDNAANAGIILGKRIDNFASVDLRWISSIVKRNGTVEETGLGGGVLDNPAIGIVWLARRLAHYSMEILPGEIILSGSFIRPVEAHSGCHILADFNQYGSIECNFL